MFGRHVAVNADFGATWHITEQAQLPRFVSLLELCTIPPQLDNSSCSFFSPNLLTRTQSVYALLGTLPLSASMCRRPPTAWQEHPCTRHVIRLRTFPLPFPACFSSRMRRQTWPNSNTSFRLAFGIRGGFRYRHRAIDDNDFETASEIFFPNNANRGDCALARRRAPTRLRSRLVDGAFAFATPDPAASPDETLINEYSGVFGSLGAGP